MKRIEPTPKKEGVSLDRAKSKYFNTAARMDEALIELLEKKDFEYITVKEICEKAGVNRSTFYLHYETVGDLLSECVEYTNAKCFAKYSKSLANVGERLSSGRREDVIFISPEYLTPFFEFVRDNRRLFKVVLTNPRVMNAEGTFRKMFSEIFSPALDRFSFSESEKPYIVLFYIGGIMAVIGKWIKGDCAEPVEYIANLCMRCVLADFGKS